MIAFHVTLPSAVHLGLDERKKKLVSARYEENDGRLEKPGFELPDVVGGELCSRYVEEQEQVLEWFGTERTVLYPSYTNFYDLLGDRHVGYILVGKSELDDGIQALALYLEALGLEPEQAAASPLGVTDSQMKEIFFEPHVTRKTFKAWGMTHLTLGTSLPELTLDKYYQILEQAGITDEPWAMCEFLPPPLPLAGRSPPMIHLRPNGFTVRSSYREPGNWHYVDWLLRELERVLKLGPIARRRTPSLDDFRGTAKGPGPPRRSRAGRG